jgi:flavin reductase (DIM6/NTAB) family NADH-FMN oxidoreductase RutF
MEVYELPNNTKAATGYTHKAVITHSDLTQTTANTAQSITLLSLEAGDIVHSGAWRLVTAFEDASDNAFNTTAVTVNAAGSALISATEANVNGSEVFNKAHTATAPLAATGASTVAASFASMTGKSLSDIDAGEVHIFFGVNKTSDL